MSQSNIIYQQTQVSFSCCVSPKHALPKTNLNHSIQPQNNRNKKDKKISLRKYQQNHMKSTQYRLSIKQSLTAGTHLKTTRLSDISEAHKMANTTNNQLWGGNRFASERHSLNLRADTRPSFENYEERYHLPAQSNPEFKILAKTTKIQRIQPSSEELKKTLRGGTQFHKIKKLSSLKESVCSYSGSGQEKQRFQQSQIMLDFFHPSVTRLNAIETLIKHPQIEPLYLDKHPDMQ